MPLFMMFGKYSTEAIKGISAARTKKAVDVIKKQGGKVISMYSLLGETDLVITVDLPDMEKAMGASLALTKLTGISFTTSPAMEVNKFDKLVGPSRKRATRSRK